VLGAAEFLVILQIRKAAGLRSEADVAGEDAGKEKGVIADVCAEEKAGAVIGLLQGGDHVKEIVKRVDLAGQDAAGSGGFGKGGEEFGHVIGDGAVGQSGTFEDVPHKHVKIETAGNPEAAAVLKEGVEEVVVVQNQVAGVFVGEELGQAGGGAEFAAEDFEDKLNILRSELHTAIGLDDFHRVT